MFLFLHNPALKNTYNSKFSPLYDQSLIFIRNVLYYSVSSTYSILNFHEQFSLRYLRPASFFSLSIQFSSKLFIWSYLCLDRSSDVIRIILIFQCNSQVNFILIVNLTLFLCTSRKRATRIFHEQNSASSYYKFTKNYAHQIF